MGRTHLIGLFLAATAFTAGGLQVLSTSGALPSPSTVVVIGLESTRADHVGPCYGYNRSTAQGICGLAEDGVLFEQAYATGSWTIMSLPSFFTARTPPRGRDVVGG